MKKFITAIILSLSFGLIGGGLTSSPIIANAEESQATALAYDEVWINDLACFYGTGATYDQSTLEITSVVPGARFGFVGNGATKGSYKNVEVATTINFSEVGSNVIFNLRASGTYDGFIGAAQWENSGYMFVWYTHGQYEVYKNGTNISGTQWGPLPAPVAGQDYTVKFRTVDMSDGSVNIFVSINDAVFYNGFDTTDPIISSGWYAISSGGCTFSAKGNPNSNPKVYDPYDLSPAYPLTPSQGITNEKEEFIPFFNGPESISDDGVVTTSSSGQSGITYSFNTKENTYGYRLNVTPSSASGSLIFTIGSKKTNAREYNNIYIVDSEWAWAEPGYYFMWNANGQRFFGRGNNGGLDGTSLIEYVWNAPGFTPDATYTIEFTMKTFASGNVRVMFKINGTVILSYLDVKTDSHTPVTVDQSTNPTSTLTNIVVYSSGVSTTITPVERHTYTTKNLLTSDLGLATASEGSIVDRNGGVELNGSQVSYDANAKDYSVKFNANFNTIGSYLIFNTNDAYGLMLYANGMITLYKNGAVAIGDTWNSYLHSFGGFATNTDYTIEVGTLDLGSATRVFVKVNDKYVINYLDGTNPVTNPGSFSISNGGYSGTLEALDIVPTLNATNNEKIWVGDQIDLSYQLTNKQDSDVVEYLIDEVKSTATGTIVGNKLTCTSEGTLVVYVSVNGVYSKELTLTILEPVAVLSNVPSEPINIGNGPITLDGEMSDGSQINSKEFYVVNGTGSATIDKDTGVLTPVSVGTVEVYVVVNGKESERETIEIQAILEIQDIGTDLALGGTYTLQHLLHVSLGEEPVTYTWEIIEGNSLATIDSNTGVITVLDQTGQVTVQLTATCGSRIEKAKTTLTLVQPTLEVVTMVQHLYQTESFTLDLTIVEGGYDLDILAKEIIITSGNELVEINGLSILAKEEGIVTFKVKAGEIESVEYTLEIKKLTSSITNAPSSSLVIGNEPITLDGKLINNANIETIEFYVENKTGSATLDKDTGLLTPVSVGTIEVYAVINGVTSERVTIEISPKLTIEDGSYAKGGSYQLNYTSNVELPEETIISNWEIIEGNTVATIDPSTGVITGLAVGTAKVQLTLSGTILPETVVTKVITIANPIINVHDRELTIICISQELTLNPSIEQGGVDLNNVTKKIVILSGSELVEVEGLTIKAKEIGQFSFKLVIDGVDSEVVEMTIEEKPYAMVTNLPKTPVVVDGEQVVIDGKMSDNSEITSKEFYVVNGTGSATIDKDTGVLTPVSAGTIKVYVVINGIESERYVITVNPRITIEHVGSFAVGGTYDLQFEANCELPNETYITHWELLSGHNLATLNPETGRLVCGDTYGFITVRVTVYGETFSGISTYVQYAIEKPIILTHDKVIEDLYVGQVITLNPTISQGGFDVNTLTRSITIVEGEDLVEVDGLTITAIKPGLVKIKVTINGVTSANAAQFSIMNLTPTIIADEVLNKGNTQVAEVMLNVYEGTYVPTIIVWSVVEGEDVLTIDESTGLITALKGGVAIIKVTIDNKYEATMEIKVVAEKVGFVGIENGDEFTQGDEVNIGFEIYDEEVVEPYNYEYVIVEGEELVEIEDDVLKVIGVGNVTIKVVVNTYSSEEITFSINAAPKKVTLTGIKGQQQFEIGESFTLGYTLSEYFGEVTSVEYIATIGAHLVSIEGNKVTALEAGYVLIEVVVNGVSSNSIEFLINAPVIIPEKKVTLTGIKGQQQLEIGDEITLGYELSDKFGQVTSVQYVVTSGAHLVSIEDNKLTALSAGYVLIKVIVNGISSNPVEFTIYEPVVIPEKVVTLTGIVGQQQLEIGDEVTLGYTLSDQFDEVTSVEYIVVLSEHLVSIEDNKLTALSAGYVLIKVVVNGISSKEVEFTINEPVVIPEKKVTLTGIEAQHEFNIGDEVTLGYTLSDQFGEVTSVEYVVTVGSHLVTIEDNKLTAIAGGYVKVKVVVNGVSSNEVEFTIKIPDTKPETTNKVLAIVLGTGSGLIVIGGVVLLILKRKILFK